MITTLLLPLGLAFIMFSMGLSLIPADFKRVFVQPKPIAVGLLCQMILLPLIAFSLLSLWPLSPELAVGVMILAACPGGITSNLLTHLARGDVALSISLTAITSVAGVISLPLIVNVALSHFAGQQHSVALPVSGMVLAVLLVSTLPLLLGMAIRYCKPHLSRNLESVSRRISTLIFALIVAAAFISQWHNLMQYFQQVGPLAIGLNVATMGVALAVARGFKFNRIQGIAISMECGLQNGALGIFVATSLLESELMMVPSIIYALIMNVSAACFILISTASSGGPVGAVRE